MNDRVGWDWLPLVRELSRSESTWTIWKHIDSALAGDGDIDGAAPRASWDRVSDSLADAAKRLTNSTHLLSCDHVPDARLHFLVDPASLPLLREVDVASRCSRLGAPWASAEDLAALSEEPDGYRIVRPGAQAFIEAFLYGVDRLGRYRPSPMALARILDGLRSDGDGAILAARVLPPAGTRHAAISLVDALIADENASRAAARLVGLTMLSGMSNPLPLMRRVRFRAQGRCALVDLAMSGRRLNENVEEFLTRAEPGHGVLELR